MQVDVKITRELVASNRSQLVLSLRSGDQRVVLLMHGPGGRALACNLLSAADSDEPVEAEFQVRGQLAGGARG